MNEIKARREEILRICKKHGGHNVRVFGSVVRGEENESSDLDLLMDFDEGCSLIDLVAVWQDLEELLGVKVDVVTEGALHRLIKDQVLKDAVEL